MRIVLTVMVALFVHTMVLAVAYMAAPITTQRFLAQAGIILARWHHCPLPSVGRRLVEVSMKTVVVAVDAVAIAVVVAAVDVGAAAGVDAVAGAVVDAIADAGVIFYILVPLSVRRTLL